MTMRFRKFGTTYQLRIENAQDLANILALDEALWVATSAPVGAFRCDRKFLELVNRDGSGRINTDELRAAIDWMLNLLTDTTFPEDAEAPLRLDGIRAESPEGARLISAGREVLALPGSAGGAEVTLCQVREFLVKLRERTLNGDGVVVPDAASGEPKQLILDVLACTGTTEDASGKQGIAEDQLDAFIAAVRGLLEWREAGQGVNASNRVPFGKETPQIYAHFIAIAAEVDAFFHACRLLRYEEKAAGYFGTANFGDVGVTDREGMDAWLQTRPLAKVNSEGRLPLL